MICVACQQGDHSECSINEFDPNMGLADLPGESLPTCDCEFCATFYGSDDTNGEDD